MKMFVIHFCIASLIALPAILKRTSKKPRLASVFWLVLIPAILTIQFATAYRQVQRPEKEKWVQEVEYSEGWIDGSITTHEYMLFHCIPSVLPYGLALALLAILPIKENDKPQQKN